MTKIVAVVVALLAAIHVGIPAMCLPAPVPVFLALAGAIFTLAFMVAGPLRRYGLRPVWLRVVPE